MGYQTELYENCWRCNYTSDVSVSDIALVTTEIGARLDRGGPQYILHDFTAVTNFSDGCAAVLVFSLNGAKGAVAAIEKIAVVSANSQFSYLVNQFAKQRPSQKIQVFDKLHRAEDWFANLLS